MNQEIIKRILSSIIIISIALFFILKGSFFFHILFTKLLNSKKLIVDAIIIKISHEYLFKKRQINKIIDKTREVNILFDKFLVIKFHQNFFLYF